MNRLFIDSSFKSCSLLLDKDGQTFFKKNTTVKSFAEDVILDISEIAKQAGIKTKDIDQIYLTIGPGSYTGIRIPLTIAKTYAFLNPKIEVYALNSIKALTLGNYDPVMGIEDARNEAFYLGIYQGDKELVAPARYEKDQALELIEKYKPTLVSTIESSQLISSELLTSVQGKDIARLMYENYQQIPLIKDVLALAPIYLESQR
ncbi:MAG: tRNA (adenosine(37)-N6)-threonylcarbamoyltransferase complex dimerization subunit type 1 TsaB [Firmicutes bacterium]|uniref:tRNA (Adenosine(37)-N6)-threonylcarbamoyltransferase complex dimerization subunit type 1 TsaB n=1 Tax=Candidatus Scatoplasma merdavium TaxID=2840932 RepID=A0A9D9GSI6_9BACL|nr:tRNA (adenosine(37)-N6)-threonylcarbamoyltransferase complex dimerization subunit type 1 TsaB [Candidatus Scatoplasma merdavium]